MPSNDPTVDDQSHDSELLAYMKARDERDAARRFNTWFAAIAIAVVTVVGVYVGITVMNAQEDERQDRERIEELNEWFTG